jgi:hypothetical protein
MLECFLLLRHAGAKWVPILAIPGVVAGMGVGMPDPLRHQRHHCRLAPVKAQDQPGGLSGARRPMDSQTAPGK